MLVFMGGVKLSATPILLLSIAKSVKIVGGMGVVEGDGGAVDRAYLVGCGFLIVKGIVAISSPLTVRRIE